MQLSEHFSRAELEHSDTALRLGIHNVVPEALLGSLVLLCTSILEPIRARFGVPVLVNSGYRCPALNAAIGSKPSSEHLLGRAADIELPPHSNYEVACWVRDHLPFGQLILENYTRGRPSSGWVHVSIPSKAHRGQVMTMVLGSHGPVYLSGLLA